MNQTKFLTDKIAQVVIALASMATKIYLEFLCITFSLLINVSSFVCFSLALLRKILVENPTKRATISVIQSHQWYTKTYCRDSAGMTTNLLVAVVFTVS